MKRLPLSVFAIMGLMVLDPPAHAQFQASNTTGRTLGLKVGAVEPGLPTTVTVEGPPQSDAGLPYLLLYENGSTADNVFSYGSLPNPLLLPVSLDLNRAVLLNQLLPTSGRHIFNLPPDFTDFVSELQAVYFDPLQSRWVASNAVRRVSGALPPNLSSFTLNVPPPSFVTGSTIEVEQADVDGDGDPDTLFLSNQSPINYSNAYILFSNQDTILPDPNWFASVPGSLRAAKFADLDNDNWNDLIIISEIRHTTLVTNIHVYRNLGHQIDPSGALVGPWLGFDTFPGGVPITFDPARTTWLRGQDVETDDIDGDGYIDIVVAGGTTWGLPVENALLLNTTSSTGFVSFVEMTRTLLNTTGPVIDDSHDVEFADLDLDGDRDLVFANLGSPDTYYVNNAGTFSGPTAIDPAAPVQTMDIAVGDLNDDGFPDLYAGKWIDGAGLAIPDKLYLTQGTKFSWVDSSSLLPDNGPNAIPAVASSDVEIRGFTDGVDPVGSPKQILVASGDRFFPAVPPSALFGGLRHLYLHIDTNGFVLSGLLPPELVLGATSSTVGVNDIELGDFQNRSPAREVGLATDTQQSPAFRGVAYLTQ